MAVYADASIYQLLNQREVPLDPFGAMQQGQRSAIGQLALQEARRQQQVDEQTRALYRQYYGQGGAPAAPGAGMLPAPGAAPSGAVQETVNTPYSSELQAMLAQYQGEGADVTPTPGPRTLPTAGAGLGAGSSPHGVPTAPGHVSMVGQALGGPGMASPHAGVDRAGLARALYQIDPKAGAAAEQATLDSETAKLTMVSKQNELVSSVARAILLDDTQAGYERGMAYLRQVGIPVDHLPRMYDRRMVEQYYAWSTDTGQRLQEAHARLAESQGLAFRAKAGRDVAETQAVEGIQALDAEPPGAAGPAAAGAPPTTMSEADIADAMRQTGRSRQEIVTAARAKGYRLPGDLETAAPPPAAAPAQTPALASPPAPAPTQPQALRTSPATSPAALPAPAPPPAREVSPRLSPDEQRLRRLEQIRDQQEQQVERVRSRYGTSEAGKTRLEQAERELSRYNSEINQLRTQITQQREKAVERRLPSAEVRDELLAMGVAPETATPTQMQEAGRIPPIQNERQAAAYDYGSRALQADTIVSGLESTGKYGKPWVDSLEDNLAKIVGGVGAVIGFAQSRGLGGGGAGAGAGAAAGTMAEPLLNALRSSDDQEYLQAKIDFISAVLRKESGAAISAGEFSRENRRYFPQPYDSDRVKQQKARARQGVIEGLREAAGRPLREPPPYAPAPSELYAPGGAGVAP